MPACDELVEAGEVSWHHNAHDLAGALTFLSFVFAPLFTGLSLRHLPDWPSTVFTPVLLVLLIVYLGDRVSGSGGSFQRVILTSAFLWMAVLGLRLCAVIEA